jgi:Uma2 family endonuclease
MTATTRRKGKTLADLLDQLGDISPERIRRYPPPGRATEKDVLRILDHENRLFELVDGVLVEKPMGWRESFLTMFLVGELAGYLRSHDLGVLTGPDGPVRLALRLVRMPDIAFFVWDHFPNRELSPEAIPSLAPDLAIEVLSKSNTIREIQRKIREYFEAGTRLVWIVDPQARTVEVYTRQDRSKLLTESQTLDGGDVLPGFTLSLSDLFARLGESGTKRGKKPRRKNGKNNGKSGA